MSKVRVAPLRQLPPGELAQVEAGGRVLALCNHEGTVHAFDGVCPHNHGPLGQGNLAEGYIVCPWHAWAFHCETGELEGDPDVRLERVPVEIVDGDVFVVLD